MSEPTAVIDQIAGHITERLSKSTLITDPFPYLVTDDVLPPEIFSRLITDLPGPSELTPMSQIGLRNVSRYEKHLTALFQEIPDRSDPAVWSAVARGLLDLSVERAVRQIFLPYVPTAADQRELIREVRLDCGQAGAYLEPHTDSPVCLMKSLIHVSPETSHPTADTLLYRPRDREARRQALGDRGDFTPGSYTHESSEDHAQVARVTFKPNRMWTFFRTPESLHGLGPLAEEVAPRYIIAAHYRFVRA